MAIKLASAIGEQRKPVDVLGGVGDAIGKVGDTIIKGINDGKERERKKAEQDQAYKDAIVANMNIKPLENVRAEDRAEYENFVKSKMGDLIIASKDRNVSKGQIEQMQRDILDGINTRHYTYQRDYEYGKKLKEDEAKGYMVEDMKNFITGKENFTPTAPTESISQQGGGYGVPTQEESLGTVEASGTPYFSKTLEERALTPIEDEYSKRVKMPTLGALEALKDIRGKEFSANDFVTRTVNKEGGWDYSVDKAKVEDEANKYAIHMIGNTNYGKNQNQTKVAMEKQAYLALQQAGLSDSEIAKEMPNVVRQLAYDDFMRKVQPAIDGELTRQKEEPLRREGKGINLNFNSNGSGGGSNKYWNVEKGETRDLNKAKDGVPTKDKLGKYTEYTFESIATPENAKVLNIGGYNDAVMKAAEVNDETGKVEYIRIVVPEINPTASNNYKEQKGGERMVKVSQDQVNSLRTNLGGELFDNTIGKAQKAAPKKEAAKDYGNRNDGTPKGKGYFGELKMDDGSIATEIAINFDDVLGGALIPSLVPTLTEAEKKYLLKGNKATKEIQLKAIKHAEERASKGLSPFVDGGELKSKSGKPIYWDKTAKTYKYK
jgi:hypothetical protein